jgi:YD repeat-containing protein
MLTQKDERGITKTNEYDGLGRIIGIRDDKEWYSFKYGATGFEKMRLTGIISSSSGAEVNYSYDRYGNLIAENRKIRHEIDGYYDEESFPVTYGRF